jgi:hypothetical protein
MLANLKTQARELKNETYALYLAAREAPPDKRAGLVGAAIIVLNWIVAIIVTVLLVRRLIRIPVSP